MALALCLFSFGWLSTAGAQTGQTGLMGEYYDDENLGTLVETRLDAVVDFTNWSGGAPTGTAVTPDDTYSERWTGAVRLDAAGDWTFSTVSNDGVRLFIGGLEVISNWTQHAATTDSVTLSLMAGLHPVTLEHYQDGGGVTIQLKFEGPGQPEVVIPTDYLCPAPVSNFFPSVDVGLDRYVVPPDDSIVLQSVAFDPDGGAIAQTQWVQLAGAPVTLAGATTSDLTVSDLVVPDDYVFEVMVWDDAGLTASASLTVTLADCPPTAPVPIWKKWSTIVPGPVTDEASTPNPFLDYRLNATFTHGGSGETWIVPGFFDADGRPHDSSATGGNTWRVNFAPPRTGGWVYEVSFRQGLEIAISEDPAEGVALANDGLTGCFQVGPPDVGATGFHLSGPLVASGGHYLRTAGDNKPFLQAGANSPENLLAYFAFDQTSQSHGYFNHIVDWNTGDPKWQGLGKGLVGAMNYLASEGMNTIWFLTFNVAGDGNDVWPWTSSTERVRYDTSKLSQWNQVFDHMNTLGMQMYVVTQEQENDTGLPALDQGMLGTERKLYYRELIARYGHHLGIIWNLGEENTNSDFWLRQFHDYIQDTDPYNHPIVIHTFPSQYNKVFDPLLSTDRLDGISLAIPTPPDTHDTVLYWRERSAEMGRPWFVGADEVGPPSHGVLEDSLDPTHDDIRKGALWGNLMAGGGGVQWYFGVAFPENDINLEDYRTRTNMWKQTKHAMDFFHTYLPFDQMDPADDLVSATDAWCFAKQGEVYAVYLPTGGTTQLDLGLNFGAFKVSWYDPRIGGPLFQHSTVLGPGEVLLTAPTTGAPGDDWVALIKRKPMGKPPVHVGLRNGPLPKVRTKLKK